jgi:hypothetical protein
LVSITWLGVVAVLLLPVVAYAQYRISRHTQGAAKALVARGILIVVGAAFGYVASRNYPDDGRLLVFLCGLGVVHLPAAVILFLKHQRGSGKS